MCAKMVDSTRKAHLRTLPPSRMTPLKSRSPCKEAVTRFGGRLSITLVCFASSARSERHLNRHARKVVLYADNESPGQSAHPRSPIRHIVLKPLDVIEYMYVCRTLYRLKANVLSETRSLNEHVYTCPFLVSQVI